MTKATKTQNLKNIGNNIFGKLKHTVTYTISLFILASQVKFEADVDVGVSPVMKQGRHEIQFECLMSDVQLSTSPGNDIMFDVIWYIHKSGRKLEVHREENVPVPLITGQSVLQNYQGLHINVSICWPKMK